MLNEFENDDPLIRSCVEDFKSVYLLRGNGLSTQYLLDAGVGNGPLRSGPFGF